ncbi:hypothetical protein [Legionella sp. km772]|uniref:hypothetical protein n=1 Tax=Legionella sp. km772 TaxID=2498111 RepID=UPI0013159C70|nr:hypothetical protein [Legionella sp. km772]
MNVIREEQNPSSTFFNSKDFLDTNSPPSTGFVPNTSPLINSSLTLGQERFKETSSLLKSDPDYSQQLIQDLGFLIHNISFIFFLCGQNKQLINQILENQSFLSYLAGQPIQLHLKNKEGQIELQTQQMSTHEAITYLQESLKRRYTHLATIIWRNKTLSSFLSGYPTAILIRNEAGGLEIFHAQLSSQNLIKFFHQLLSSRNQLLVNAVWGNLNSPLCQAIDSTQDPVVIKQLTQRVLDCGQKVNMNKFIKQFLSFIPSTQILEELLVHYQ